MKQKYYAAKEKESLLHVTTVLGKNQIIVGIADKELNWHTIELNEEQSARFKQFMKESDV